MSASRDIRTGRVCTKGGDAPKKKKKEKEITRWNMEERASQVRLRVRLIRRSAIRIRDISPYLSCTVSLE